MTRMDLKIEQRSLIVSEDGCYRLPDCLIDTWEKLVWHLPLHLVPLLSIILTAVIVERWHGSTRKVVKEYGRSQSALKLRLSFCLLRLTDKVEA